MDMEIEMEMEEEEEDENINQIIINRLIDIIYSPSFSNISYSYQDDSYGDIYYNREEDIYYNREQEEEILNTSFINDKKKYKTVLSNDDEQLKIIKYIKNSNNDENDKCPIMSTIFEDGQDIIQLPCNHSFEPEAIKKWLKEEKAECPVCRYNEFKTKEIKIEEEEENERRPTIARPTIATQQMSYFTDIFIQYEEEYNN